MTNRPGELVRRRVRVTGRVQGVFFRQSARREAERLGVAGFARNEADGSVTLELEGDQEAVAAMTAWCGQGPPGARVEAVSVEEIEPRGERGFAAS